MKTHINSINSITWIEPIEPIEYIEYIEPPIQSSIIWMYRPHVLPKLGGFSRVFMFTIESFVLPRCYTANIEK